MAKPAKRGGRQPGAVNKANALIRDRIEMTADPIGFLTRIMLGEEIECAPSFKNAPAVDLAQAIKGSASGGTVKVRPNLDQRIAAANKLADKLMPSPRSRAITLPIPTQSASPGDLDAAADTVMLEMTEGRITLDEAEQAMTVIAKRRDIFMSGELERRIAELEQQKGTA